MLLSNRTDDIHTIYPLFSKTYILNCYYTTVAPYFILIILKNAVGKTAIVKKHTYMRTYILRYIRKLSPLWMMIFWAYTASSQVLVEWPLDGNQLPTVLSSDISADLLTTGDNISALMYTASSAREPFAFSTGWSTDANPSIRSYYEICFSPNAGKTITISSLEFKIKSATTINNTVTGPKDFQVQWSIDGFEHAHLLYTASSTATSTLHQISNWDKTLCDGQQICIRWYGYNASSSASTWDFIKNSIKVKGTVDAICTPPTLQGTSNVTNISSTQAQINCNNGNGDHRLILAKLDAPVDWIPCSGETFTANTQFGLGDELGVQNYVIYSGPSTGSGTTTVNITNLEQGRDYHIAVFEYNSASNCFQQSNPARASFTTGCTTASDVFTPLAYGFDGNIHLSWDAPYCFDEILIIASDAPITGTPGGTGANYTANAQYGLGSDAGGDFPAGEYPIYKGGGNTATTTGLNLNTDYYFKIFARLGTSWSSGQALNNISANGCAELNGDVIFINELHYKNNGPDVNEGIEVFGPANVNLNDYEIHFYKANGALHQTFDKMINLSGVIDDEGDGYGAIWFDVPNIFDGIGAVCLYNSQTSQIVQFLSYRADQQVADDGIAMGLTATGMYDTGGTTVAGETGTMVGESLQLFGTGSCPSDFTWEKDVPQTRGMLNVNQFILPIELLYFDAYAKNNEMVEISWATAIEKNNDYMVVQRSANGRDFEDLQMIKGAGNSQSPIYYNIDDRHPLKGESFYRLKQVDFDGTTVYHKVRRIYIKSKNNPILVYPTIVSENITVSFDQKITDDAMIYIFDMNGQRLISQQFTPGTKELNIAVSALPKGIYFVNIQEQQRQQTFKIIKN